MAENTQAAAAPANRFDVFVVEDYKDRAGEDRSTWLRVGVAFPHRDGKGFTAELRAMPTNGKLVLRIHEPPNAEA